MHATALLPNWDNLGPLQRHLQTHGRCTPWRQGYASCSPGRKVPPAPRDPSSSTAGLPAAVPGPWSPPRARLLRDTRCPEPRCGWTCKPNNLWFRVKGSIAGPDDNPGVTRARGCGPYYSCLSRRQCITVMSLMMTENKLAMFFFTPGWVLFNNEPLREISPQKMFIKLNIQRTIKRATTRSPSCYIPSDELTLWSPRFCSAAPRYTVPVSLAVRFQFAVRLGFSATSRGSAPSLIPLIGGWAPWSPTAGEFRSHWHFLVSLFIHKIRARYRPEPTAEAHRTAEPAEQHRVSTAAPIDTQCARRQTSCQSAGKHGGRQGEGSFAPRCPDHVNDVGGPDKVSRAKSHWGQRERDGLCRQWSRLTQQHARGHRHVGAARARTLSRAMV